MMSGAWPPPAPSVWKAWMVRPLKAAMVSSTKPLSLSVSVWIITCTSKLVGDARGSCRSSRASCPSPRAASAQQAPARTISSSGAGREALPLPASARFIGKSSNAPIMCMMCQAPVQVVASVPCAGPVPPPSIVVMPRHQRFLDLLRRDEVDVGVHAAGGEDLALAGDDLGRGADDDGDARLGVRIAGLADARRCGRS